MRANVVLWAMAASASIAGAQETVRLVAEFGQPLPGATGTLDSVETPALLADGTAVFRAFTSDGESGVWINGPDGVTTPLIVEGDSILPLVGRKGIVTGVGEIYVDNLPSIVFGIGYDAPIGDDLPLVLSYDPVASQWAIVRESIADDLPLPDGITGRSTIEIQGNQSGTLLYQRGIDSPVHGASLDTALWRGDDPELVFMTQEEIGGTRPMTAVELYEPRIRENGGVLVEVRSSDIVVLGRREWPDEGLFEFTPSGELIELGRVGDSVPDADPEAFISAVDSRENVAANSAGETAYLAIFRNDFTGPHGEGDVIILHTPAGERLRVIGRGQKPTGTPPGGPELVSLRVMAMTRTGGVVFDGKLDGPQTFEDEGLWIGSPGGRTAELLMENKRVPGYDDWRVKDTGPVLPLRTGDLLVGADIGPFTLTHKFPALYFKNVVGPIRPLLGYGGVLDLGTGRQESIERVNVIQGAARPYLGGNRVENDAGQVLLTVRSQDADRFLAVYQLPVTCPADCDGNGALNLFDFLCFQSLFSAGLREADCDGNGELDLFDFLCFQSAFSAGCS
ncbi:MAG: GC-type dockerin domain-anchored protein [Phycisphaerales bacterium JB060]